MLPKTINKFIKKEYSLLLTISLYIILNIFKTQIDPNNINSLLSSLISIIIFAFLLICSMNVVKHADWLSEKFGEPYGTIILTLSVVCIEAGLIMTIMLTGKGEPSLARDAMFSVMMIAVNGLCGVSLICGGLKYKNQRYNLEGANAFLAILIPIFTICLIMPSFTKTTQDGTLSTFQSIIVIVICLILFGTFLIKQTITHKGYFHFSATEQEVEHKKPIGSVLYNFIILVIGLTTIILLSKNMAVFLEYKITKASLPYQLSGFIVALLVLTPEGISAIKSAAKNELQKSINLCIGSAVASICLTIPAVLILSMIFHHKVVLGLDNISIMLLVLTFFTCVITFSAKKTSMLYGMIMTSMFILYVALIFDGVY